MWAIRVLTGPQAGQVFPLPDGKSRVGRGPACSIQINGQGVSKEHLEIMVLPDKILVNDLRSSNGTFLNGVRIQGGFLKIGDKVLLGQVMCDIVLMQERSMVPGPIRPLAPAPLEKSVQHMGTPSQYPMAYGQRDLPAVPATKTGADFGGFVKYQNYKVNEYVENVVLEGVYRLPQTFEFRFVLMGFVAAFIVVVTLLAIIPLKQITSESIATESQRRALTVARALSEINQRVLRSGDYSGFRTDLVMKEEGIEDSYVLASDGRILAPPERIGLTPKQAGFITKIRRNPTVETTDTGLDGKIVASVPVVMFDGELQQNVAKAYAVVVYNPGNLTFDDGRAFSLFIQVLLLAILGGVVLFFFLYKMIQYPFRMLHEKLDISLRDGLDSVQIEFNFPALQNLLTSINSLLSRVAAGGAPEQASVGKGSRDTEIANLMQLIGYPSILISREGLISRLSPSFEQLTGISQDRLVGAKISDIPDPAMQQNFNHLMSQSQMNLSQIFTDSLDIGGHNFNLNCQAMANAVGDIEYFLITVTPVEGQEGAA